MMQTPFVAPLFVEDGEFTSTLVLANGTAVPTYADIALRSMDGRTVATQTIQFKPHSTQELSIRTLREAGSEPNITTGSVVVSQTPSANGMTVLGALSITQLSTNSSRYIDQILAKPGYIDQELAMPSDESSLALRGVADGSDGSPLVAITSLNKLAQHVTVTCLDGNQAKSSKLTLAPEQTVLMPVCDPVTKRDADLHWYAENLPPGSHGPVGIELTSDGAPGSFAAYGLALHDGKQGKYFSSIVFADPKMLMSATAVYAGVPVGSSPLLSTGTYTPVLSLANFSSSLRQVSVKYALTRDGAASLSTVANVTLASHSTQEVVLSGLNGDSILRDSFLVESDGAPDDVLSKLVSKSDGPLREVELLAKDLEEPENGGNHPWTVANGTISTLLLFNESDKPQWFNVQISAGTTVWQKRYQLQPNRTEAIGINDLIRTAAKDDRGKAFPSDIWSGQVGWYVSNRYAGQGRILQSNPTTGMARNFSCGWILMLCSGDLTDVSSNPIPVGQTVEYGTMILQTCMNTCYGDPVAGGYPNWYEWSSGSPSIASIADWDDSGNVQVTGVGVGSANITGAAGDDWCTVDVYGTATVGDQTPVITSMSPNTWQAGVSNSVTVSGGHFGTNPTLSFSPDGGYSYYLGSHSDWQITAYITPPASASGTVAVTVTSTGYNGFGFAPVQGQSGGASSSANATVAPGVDHLRVVIDNEGFPNDCPSTGVYLRQMQMQVVGTNNQAITNGPSVVESYAGLTTNTCGTGQPMASSCAPTDSSGQFLDSLGVSLDLCNSGVSQSSGCGYSLTSTWSACGTTGSKTLWVSPRVTLSNGVEVDGRWTRWPTGTQCASNGC